MLQEQRDCGGAGTSSIPLLRRTVLAVFCPTLGLAEVCGMSYHVMGSLFKFVFILLNVFQVCDLMHKIYLE